MPLALIISDCLLDGRQVAQGTILELDDSTANQLVTSLKAKVGNKDDLEAAAKLLFKHPTEVTW